MRALPRAWRLAARVACRAALALCLLVRPAAADPRSDFFCRMLADPDPRVRTTAALRLRELRSPDSVEPIVRAFGTETHAPTRAALVAALGAIGDPRALPTVEAASRDTSPAVRAQAARARGALRVGGPAAPRATAAAPRYRFRVGAFASTTARPEVVREHAVRCLAAALAHRPEVAPEGSAAPRLRRYVLDGNVGELAALEGAVRARVSLVVETDPGRVYLFESGGTARVTVAPDASPDARSGAEDEAVRHAVEAALAAAIDQLSSMASR